MSFSKNDISPKRVFSNDIAEGSSEMFMNSKRGKHVDDFDIVSSLGDNSFNDIDSDDGKSYVDDLQSISSALVEPKSDDDVAESIHIVSETISCLQDDIVVMNQTITNLVKTVTEQQKQLELIQKLYSQSIEMNKVLQSRNRMLESELGTVRAEGNLTSPTTSYDGTYLWKITDFTEKLADAVSEKQTSIYSPPFYSSPNGYKMCIRIYLQGDGQARRTHLSLFFVLLRGENDALLSWPFNHRVTFCLFDQSAAKRHIVDSFRPDSNSNSFQRPRSSMNIASGIPRFFPLNMIQQSNNPYVRDDTMFIRCIVDFDSIPKEHMATICTYNLALPTTKRNKDIEEILKTPNAKTNEKVGEAEVTVGKEPAAKIEQTTGRNTMEFTNA